MAAGGLTNQVDDLRRHFKGEGHGLAGASQLQRIHQRLQLGLLSSLQLCQRQEALDDIAEILTGLLVAGLSADAAANPAVDVAVG